MIVCGAICSTTKMILLKKSFLWCLGLWVVVFCLNKVFRMWHLEAYRGLKILFTGLRMKTVYTFARKAEDLCRYK